MSGLLTEFEGCPCGGRHLMAAQAAAAFRSVTAGLDLAVAVRTPDGCWLVPRLYIACHGLKAAELPELAGRYGFERAP